MSTDDLEAELRKARARIVVLETAAARAPKVDDSLMRLLAHELRSPLAPVLTAAQLLEDEETLSSDARRWLSVVKRNALATSAMVDDVLELLRIRERITPPQPEEADLHDLIRDALHALRDDIAHRRIVATQTLSATRSRVFCQRARLLQAISGLLRVAVKGTPSGGEIAISTWDEEGSVLVSVSHPAGTSSLVERLPAAVSLGESALVPLGATGLAMLFALELTVASGSTLSVQHRDQKLTYAIRSTAL